MIKEYDVFLKGRQIFKVKEHTRSKAVKKAKNWFTKQVRSGRLKEGLNVRSVLSVSDKYREVKFSKDKVFKTSIDENNFLRPEDLSRVVKESDGYLEKNNTKSKNKNGPSSSQLKKTNKKLSYTRVKNIGPLPYVVYSRTGSIFYYTKNLSESKKLTSRYIRLNSNTIDGIVKEIKDRKLYKQDYSSTAKKKVKILTKCAGCIRDLAKAASHFSWRGLSTVSFVYDRSIDQQLRIYGSKIHYNPNRGGFQDFKQTVRSIRKEMLRNASESTPRN